MKWHGAGNDFVIVESETLNDEKASALAKKVCDRHFGIGADGLMIVSQSSEADVKMRYYNSDGSYGAMCGNGIRCFASFCRYKGIVTRETVSVETGDGIKSVTVKMDEGYQVKVDMGSVVLTPEAIPAEAPESECFEIEALGRNFKAYALKVGVPHLVIEGAFSLEDVLTYGPVLEAHDRFKEKINVNFMEKIDGKTLRVTTYERGAGLTMACGTGACASAYIAATHMGLSSPLTVHVPGGTLIIDVQGNQLMMTGPAVPIAEGLLL